MMILALLREATVNAEPALELAHEGQRPMAPSATFTSETAKLEAVEQRRIERIKWQEPEEGEPSLDQKPPDVRFRVMTRVGGSPVR